MSPRGSKAAMAAPCPAGRQGPPCPPMSGSSHLSSAWPPAPGDPHAHSQGHPSTTGAWGAQAVTERSRIARQRWLKGFWPAHPFHFAIRVAGIHIALRQVRDVITPFSAHPSRRAWALPTLPLVPAFAKGPATPAQPAAKDAVRSCGNWGCHTLGGLSPGSERRMRHILAMFTLIYKRICIYN